MGRQLAPLQVPICISFGPCDQPADAATAAPATARASCCRLPRMAALHRACFGVELPALKRLAAHTPCCAPLGVLHPAGGDNVVSPRSTAITAADGVVLAAGVWGASEAVHVGVVWGRQRHPCLIAQAVKGESSSAGGALINWPCVIRSRVPLSSSLSPPASTCRHCLPGAARQERLCKAHDSAALQQQCFMQAPHLTSSGVVQLLKEASHNHPQLHTAAKLPPSGAGLDLRPSATTHTRPRSCCWPCPGIGPADSSTRAFQQQAEAREPARRRRRRAAAVLPSGALLCGRPRPLGGGSP